MLDDQSPENVDSQESEAIPHSTAELIPENTSELAPNVKPRNKGGRPKGARNKLGEQFLIDLQNVWSSRGIETIHAVIDTKPAEFLKVVASILPKVLTVSLDNASDEDIQARIDRLTAKLGVQMVPTMGGKVPSEAGTAGPVLEHQPNVPAVPEPNTETES